MSLHSSSDSLTKGWIASAEIGRLQNEEGFDAYKAVVEATVSRVRPVLLASVTTIVGMIPLTAYRLATGTLQ